MANLKEIRTRIISVRSTRKITSAMRVVSAAKYHKASETCSHFDAFSARYHAVMHNVLQTCQSQEIPLVHPLLHCENPEAPELVLLLSSNNSMCGAFNSNVARFCSQYLQENTSSVQPLLWAFGAKGAEIIQRDSITIDHQDNTLVEGVISFEAVSALYDQIVQHFMEGKIRGLSIVYNAFVNAAVQHPTKVDLLPLQIETPEDDFAQREYIFEPTLQHLLDTLIPYILKLRFYNILLQNHVGEHGARMTSMAQATDNADDLLQELTLAYNKARQTAITNELVEIVSGANALQ